MQVEVQEVALPARELPQSGGRVKPRELVVQRAAGAARRSGVLRIGQLARRPPGDQLEQDGASI